MTIADLLAPGQVVLDLRVPDKRRLIGELARRAAAAVGLPADAVAEALDARERLGSTGMGAGVALPHARLAAAERPVGLFARLRPALDFDAIDGRTVDLVFLLLLPARARGDHLDVLAGVARRLRDAEVATALRRVGRRRGRPRGAVGQRERLSGGRLDAGADQPVPLPRRQRGGLGPPRSGHEPVRRERRRRRGQGASQDPGRDLGVRTRRGGSAPRPRGPRPAGFGSRGAHTGPPCRGSGRGRRRGRGSRPRANAPPHPGRPGRRQGRRGGTQGTVDRLAWDPTWVSAGRPPRGRHHRMILSPSRNETGPGPAISKARGCPGGLAGSASRSGPVLAGWARRGGARVPATAWHRPAGPPGRSLHVWSAPPPAVLPEPPALF